MTVVVEPERIVIIRAGEDEGGDDEDELRSLDAPLHSRPVAYALENALYQWRDGERRLADAPEPARADLDLAADVVVEELRKRLGSRFLLEELADFYDAGTEWATELAGRHAAGADAAAVVDAAFARYAREASNFAGGRPARATGAPRAR